MKFGNFLDKTLSTRYNENPIEYLENNDEED
jgi:hypothetical protein